MRKLELILVSFLAVFLFLLAPEPSMAANCSITIPAPAGGCPDCDDAVVYVTETTGTDRWFWVEIDVYDEWGLLTLCGEWNACVQIGGNETAEFWLDEAVDHICELDGDCDQDPIRIVAYAYEFDANCENIQALPCSGSCTD